MWTLGTKDGQGTIKMHDGREYVGSWAFGFFHGPGKLILPGDDGLIYEGTFNYSCFLEGEIRYKSGKLFEKVKRYPKYKKKLLGKTTSKPSLK
jgi:hypothetical protein